MGIKEIEPAIEQLPATEVVELTSWIVEYHALLWDRQIEADLDEGKFDKLLAEVHKECEAGQAKEL